LLLFFVVQCTQDPHGVLALQAKTRVHQAVGQLTGTGEQQQAFGVQIQTPHRLPFALVELGQAAKHRRTILRIVVRDHFADRLVISQHARRRRCDAVADRLAVDLDLVAELDALAHMGRFVVDEDLAIGDELFHLEARTQTGLGQHLVQLGRFGLGLKHTLEGGKVLVLFVGIELAGNHIREQQRRRRFVEDRGCTCTVGFVFLDVGTSGFRLLLDHGTFGCGTLAAALVGPEQAHAGTAGRPIADRLCSGCVVASRSLFVRIALRRCIGIRRGGSHRCHRLGGNGVARARFDRIDPCLRRGTRFGIHIGLGLARTACTLDGRSVGRVAGSGDFSRSGGLAPLGRKGLLGNRRILLDVRDHLAGARLASLHGLSLDGIGRGRLRLGTGQRGGVGLIVHVRRSVVGLQPPACTRWASNCYSESAARGPWGPPAA